MSDDGKNEQNTLVTETPAVFSQPLHQSQGKPGAARRSLSAVTLISPHVLLAVPEDLTDSEKTSPIRLALQAPDGRLINDWHTLRHLTVLTWGEKLILKFIQMIRVISQNWITHVLLVLVLFSYTAIGGVMFHYVEGSHENEVKRNLDETRSRLSQKIWLSCRTDDEAAWLKNFAAEIKQYEELIISTPDAVTPEHKWDYIGSLFFSGTVFTTIAAWRMRMARVVGGFSWCAMYGECREPRALIAVPRELFAFDRSFFAGPGWHEVRVKCGVQRTRHELVNELWESASYLDADVWRILARDRLKEFEAAVHKAREVGVTTQSTRRVWSFSGALYYVVTVVTTIGYGHIVPSTDYGRALTMIYAFIGIPLILMVLADLGKMFTRTIKFVWSFVRRFYYTGSFKRLRSSAPLQAVHRLIPGKRGDNVCKTEITTSEYVTEPDTFTVDENFDLPVSIALILLLVYILLGALMMKEWESDWSYFHAVYFIFVSLTTIGFGDMVPNNPTYLLITFIYLLFGLALTSMCINVVQLSITNTFTNAKNKLAMRIGLSASTDNFRAESIKAGSNDLASVHGENNKNKSE
uniref:Potassium channel domain-containing protein n=1 Tax=Strigamia maritima TaxID=126957 RepID=T1JLU0_STRMM